MSNDTVVALATPPGQGAIAVLRVNGEQAFAAVRGLLPAGCASRAFEPRRLYLCKLGKETLLDQAMVAFYPAPNSYTGEDLAEVFCHGGQVVVTRIIAALVELGCRLARPGEFTRRAVEKGKLDLLQAEAVRDLVNAESPAAAHNALRQLDGELSAKIGKLRASLLQIAGLLEVELDFAEEDVEFADRRQIEDKLARLAATIENITATYDKGRGLRQGVRVAIIGKPNVGKSCLLNAMLGHERAIVSAQPGTTRDFIEEQIRAGGLLLRLIDTAGIRCSVDEIERQGLLRTRHRIEDADIILLVVDASIPTDELDDAAAQECESACTRDPRKKVLVVRNKIDLPVRLNGGLSLPRSSEISVSALTGEGVPTLLETVSDLAKPDFAGQSNGVCITNVRHKVALERALDSIHDAQESCAKRMSAEFVARDLRSASDELGVLVGEISSELILDEIFANFCIGK